MNIFKRSGPGGMLLAVALILCIFTVAIGLFPKNLTSSTQEWKMSCWLSPCLANRVRKFFWETYYPVGLGFPEAIAVGTNGTVAVVDRDGFVLVSAPPYSDPLRVEPFWLDGRPETAAVGPNGTVALVDRGGMVYVSSPPYSDSVPVERLPLVDLVESVAVGSNGTIALVDREGMVYVLAPPYADPVRVELIEVLGRPETAAVGPNGTIALVDSGGMVYVLTPPYADPVRVELIEILGRPEAVAVGSNGTIALVDREGMVYVLTPPYADVDLAQYVPFVGTPVAVAVGPNGTIGLVDDGGFVQVLTPPDIAAGVGELSRVVGGVAGMAVGGNGTIALMDNDGMLYALTPPYSEPVPVERFPSLGLADAFAVGPNGTIVVGNRTVVLASTPPYASASVLRGPLHPAHWTWFALALACIDMVLLLRIFLRRDSTSADREDLPTIESDKPIDDPRDATRDLVTLARRIARFVRHPEASVPLTIALTGRWGSGKSSLMKLVHKELVPKKPTTDRYPCIWFNAWHHQNEAYLFASLMESIRSSLLSEFPISYYVSFHLRLLKLRMGQSVYRSILFFAVIVAGLVALFWMLYVFVDSASPTTYLLLLIPSVPPALLATTRLNPMKAFGVSPASLIRSSARWMQFPRFRDRLSFRHQFGQAFGQVCNAFGGRRLIIIIDDLDRCRPQQVVEILEAVNFLTSNGDCFVLLGLDENQVRLSIGLHHQSIAEETYRTSDQSAYESRQEYAKNYIEKLINLTVNVPLPDYEEVATIRGCRKA